MNSSPHPVADGFAKLNLAEARHHLFLCTGPDCCPPAEGLATWATLKAALQDRGAPALRTKAACLRLCTGGPWLVVYPEGIWYGGVTPERCQRIVQEHVVAGRPIMEWVAQVHPLP